MSSDMLCALPLNATSLQRVNEDDSAASSPGAAYSAGVINGSMASVRTQTHQPSSHRVSSPSDDSDPNTPASAKVPGHRSGSESPQVNDGRKPNNDSGTFPGCRMGTAAFTCGTGAGASHTPVASRSPSTSFKTPGCSPSQRTPPKHSFVGAPDDERQAATPHPATPQEPRRASGQPAEKPRTVAILDHCIRSDSQMGQMFSPPTYASSGPEHGMRSEASDSRTEPHVFPPAFRSSMVSQSPVLMGGSRPTRDNMVGAMGPRLMSNTDLLDNEWACTSAMQINPVPSGRQTATNEGGRFRQSNMYSSPHGGRCPSRTGASSVNAMAIGLAPPAASVREPSVDPEVIAQMQTDIRCLLEVSKEVKLHVTEMNRRLTNTLLRNGDMDRARAMYGGGSPPNSSAFLPTMHLHNGSHSSSGHPRMSAPGLSPLPVPVTPPPTSTRSHEKSPMSIEPSPPPPASGSAFRLASGPPLDGTSTVASRAISPAAAVAVAEQQEADVQPSTSARGKAPRPADPRGPISATMAAVKEVLAYYKTLVTVLALLSQIPGLRPWALRLGRRSVALALATLTPTLLALRHGHGRLTRAGTVFVLG